MTTDALRFWPVTDVGRVRDANEDSFLVDKKLNLYVVADGMGGHAAGEVASSMAVRTFRDAVARARDMLDDFERGTGNVSRKDVLRLLEGAVQEACSAIHAEAQRDETKRGMGTTLTALLVIGSRGFIAHVGDSRCYLVRQGSVHQLSEDHCSSTNCSSAGASRRSRSTRSNTRTPSRAPSASTRASRATPSISTCSRATAS